MKSIKGSFLKRFRSIPSIYTSKQHIVPVHLQCESQDRLSSSQNLQNIPHTSIDLGNKNGHMIMSSNNSLAPTKEIDVFEDCDCGFDDSMPEMVSSSSSTSCNSSPTKTDPELDNQEDFASTKNLSNFEEINPPGGTDKVVLYTTSVRGIRKTFEDCRAIKFLLESFRVVYIERDVSMHLKFRDELWEVLGGRVVPPRLFIKGRYIGGADEVVMLQEVGMLKKLLQGIPVIDSLTANVKCCHCGGVRFLLCLDCSGSCKVYKGDQVNEGSLFVRCTNCNENGLIQCPTCSY